MSARTKYRSLARSVPFLALVLTLNSGNVLANESPSWFPVAKPILEELDAADSVACTDGTLREFVLIGETDRPFVLSAERDLQRQFSLSRTRAVFEGRGCGRTKRTFALNVLRVPNRRDPLIQIVPPPPSEVDGFLYPDVFQAIITTRLGLLHRGCNKAIIQSVEALGGEAWKVGESWKERWNYSACGVVDKAEIEFTYDGDGARFKNTIPANELRN